jgi:DNA topoisomerase-3
MHQPQPSPRSATYCRNFRFPFTLGGRPADMLFSSVAGHLMELEFAAPFSSWRGCRPGDLYACPVAKRVSRGEGEKIATNLAGLARRAALLVLWLDCDREGENIAFEVIQVCRAANPRLDVRRARFSALIQRDVLRAVHNLVAPDAAAAAAVDARQEIDLRVGSSFTRLQTLLMQDAFPWAAAGLLPPGRESMLLSYGPCQFPTLGLLVQREWEIAAHVAEPFWALRVAARAPPDAGAPGGAAPGGAPGAARTVEFAWARGRVFDRAVAELYHARVAAPPQEAEVTAVTGARRTRAAPAPLSTLEMQKRASQALRLSGERLMKLAEELYQGGFLSYPRTETDQFAEGYDLRGMVAAQAGAGAPWSAFAARLLAAGGGAGGDACRFRWPRSGGKDDGAHPPIHPTRPFDCAGGGDKARLYEFVTRAFLAACAPDAEGQETRVALALGGEAFSAAGLMVTARNWLDVYPWASWGGADALPPFAPGQRFAPVGVRLVPGATAPPPRMREADLLAKMDAHGIGTDATVADHIAKQLERGYAAKDGGALTLAPTPLGEALISAYAKMDLANLWRPELRGLIERNIDAVARGARGAGEVLAEAVEAFAGDFAAAASKASVLEQEVREIVFGGQAGQVNGGGGGGGGHGGGGGGPPGVPFARCRCGGDLVLVAAAGGAPAAVACAAPAVLCGLRRDLPRSVLAVAVSAAACGSCAARGAGATQMLHFTFSRGLLPPALQTIPGTLCAICDARLSELLAAMGPAARSGPPRRGRGGGAAVPPPARGGVARGGAAGRTRGRGARAGAAGRAARGGRRAARGRG